MNIDTLKAFLFLHNVVPENLCEYWAKRFHPAFEDLMEKLRCVEETSTEVEIQTIFYDVGKEYIGTDKDSLRVFFRILYTIICRRYSGPRWGVLFKMVGKEDFLWLAEQNYQNLFYISILDRDISHCYIGDEDDNLL